MKCRAAAPVLMLLALLATPAAARTLPAIKAGPGNAPAECATPGRLMAFVRQRNPDLDARFDFVAAEYMRHGEELGVRWDYAFFQMLLETGNLSYRRGDGRRGDVHPSQNNFAGLGAVGRGEPGERFPSISAGVKAHLQHLLMYAGERIENPVAERTRKVQEWGILTSWQKGLKGPVTFSDLARQWAPGDRSYAANVAAIGEAFLGGPCLGPDPRPELVAEARRGRAAPQAGVASHEPGTPGAELMKRSVSEARAEGNGQRSGLGATAMAKQEAEALAARSSAPADPARQPEDKAEAPGFRTAGAAAVAAGSAGAAAASRCRVWTASYGGQKAIIIKAMTDGFVNYTVLDVNEGAEKREVDAYIAAYAKGGQPVGEFSNQPSALDRAFELCPEG